MLFCPNSLLTTIIDFEISNVRNYLYHVMTYIDIRNEKKDENGDVIREWDFEKDPDFNKRSIFKIISHLKPFSFYDDIYLSQSFMDRIEKYKLKGLDKFPMNMNR